MNNGGTERNGRILLIDATAEEYGDFVRILGAGEGESAESFTLENVAMVGEGHAKISAAVAEGKPYAMAFIGIRAPLRKKDLQAIRALWSTDRELQIVACTDLTGEALALIEEVLGKSDRLLVLKKPFEGIEVRRLAAALEHFSFGSSAIAIA